MMKFRFQRKIGGRELERHTKVMSNNTTLFWRTKEETFFEHQHVHKIQVWQLIISYN